MNSTVSAALLVSLVCLSAVNASLFHWTKESPDSAQAKEAVSWSWNPLSGEIHADTKVYNYLRVMKIVDAASRKGFFKFTVDIAQTECYMGNGKLTKEEQDKCALDKDEDVRRCTVTLVNESALVRRGILTLKCVPIGSVDNYLSLSL